MTERLLIAGMIVLLIILILRFAQILLSWRDRRIVARLRDAAPSESPSGAPRIVYFTTTSCIVCRLQQEPAMEQLRAALPEVRIEKHDAVAEPTLADDYGVLSVPTTAVYDRSGELVTINRGFAPVAQLYAQATGAEALAEGGVDMASERIQRPE
jgi:thiol-disulfide isomerase/thioredoxin